MADKKIINKENVKQPNPNDDEEILKNNDEADRPLVKEDEAGASTTENQKTQGSETIGIP